MMSYLMRRVLQLQIQRCEMTMTTAMMMIMFFFFFLLCSLFVVFLFIHFQKKFIFCYVHFDKMEFPSRVDYKHSKSGYCRMSTFIQHTKHCSQLYVWVCVCVPCACVSSSLLFWNHFDSFDSIVICLWIGWRFTASSIFHIEQKWKKKKFVHFSIRHIILISFFFLSFFLNNTIRMHATEQNRTELALGKKEKKNPYSSLNTLTVCILLRFFSFYYESSLSSSFSRLCQ